MQKQTLVYCLQNTTAFLRDEVAGGRRGYSHDSSRLFGARQLPHNDDLSTRAADSSAAHAQSVGLAADSATASVAGSNGAQTQAAGVSNAVNDLFPCFNEPLWR